MEADRTPLASSMEFSDTLGTLQATSMDSYGIPTLNTFNFTTIDNNYFNSQYFSLNYVYNLTATTLTKLLSASGDTLT